MKKINPAEKVQHPFISTRQITLQEKANDIADHVSDFIGYTDEITSQHIQKELTAGQCTAVKVLALKKAAEILMREAEELQK